MFRRTRFQQGSLTKEERQKQPDVWVYRWREAGTDGSTKRRKIILGTVEEYRTESHARKRLAALDLNVNDKQSQGDHPALMTMAQLIDHYKAEELGEHRHSKAQSTVDVYHYHLRSWVEPRWKDVRALAVKPIEVEGWLRSLNVANGTKAKIRNIMSAVFQHGLRHQFVTGNPIRGLVRQSAKREKEPDVLTADEIRSIMLRLSPLHRTMVFLAASTGLRFSELRGLQWKDVDFESGVLHLRRGVVNGHISELKTKASRKPVPLHKAVLDTLESYRSVSPYNKPSDWVFASIKAMGRVPVWPSCIMTDHVIPAAKEAQLEKHVSWHTFRHSYATLLKANGEDVKVVQDSLRHANFHITMDTYTQTVPEAVRSAHARVVEQLSGPGLDPNHSAQFVSC